MAFGSIPSIAPRGPLGKPTSATNLVTNGGFETNTTGWVVRFGTETIARDLTKSLFGAASGKLTPVNVNDGVYHAYAGAALTQYTHSVWVWVPTGTTVRIYAWDNVAAFVGGTNAIGNDAWQRITVTATTGAAAATFRTYTLLQTAGAVAWFIDGAQVELGPVATPYIETNGGAASRRRNMQIAA